MKLDPKETIGGLLLAGVGAYFLFHSFGYGVGTPRRMGAGFFPMALGATAIVIGVLMIVRGIGRHTPLPQIEWRPAIAILGGIALFGLIVARFGLVPAVAAAALASALGDTESRPLPTAILVVAVALGVWLIFVVGLRLPIPAFRGIA